MSKLQKLSVAALVVLGFNTANIQTTTAHSQYTSGWRHTYYQQHSHHGHHTHHTHHTHHGHHSHSDHYVSRKHVAWCSRKYRSYDAYSDTFQPYHGPRKHCHSPYQ